MGRERAGRKKAAQLFADKQQEHHGRVAASSAAPAVVKQADAPKESRISDHSPPREKEVPMELLVLMEPVVGKTMACRPIRSPSRPRKLSPGEIQQPEVVRNLLLDAPPVFP